MRYEFATASRIIFGRGSAAQLPEIIAAAGRRALLVCSPRAIDRPGPQGQLLRHIREAASAGVLHVSGEPDVALAEAGATLGRALACDVVVGIGGGSALDAAKAVAALAANDGRALRYLEVVGEGRALERPALPVIAVPTTAGTGSEATRNAVLSVPERRVKASVRHASMLPRAALVDPALSQDLPPDATASTGMDALTQLLEAYVSRRATPLTDALCLQGLPGLPDALRRAYHASEEAARDTLAQAALWSGMALANAGLGAVHGIAAVVGGAYDAPHGAVCAALLPSVTRVNLRAASRAGHPALARYQSLARMLGGGHAAADDLPGLLAELAAELAIPGLSRYGVAPHDVPELAALAAKASSTRANPLDLEAEELAEAIAESLNR